MGQVSTLKGFNLNHFSAPGGTRIDEGDKAKVTAYCVFTTEESHAALRLYAQVHPRAPSHRLLMSYILTG